MDRLHRIRSGWGTLASGDKSVRVWNASSGELLVTLNDLENGVIALTFSSDGLVLSAVDPTWKKNRITLRRWETATWKSGVKAIAYPQIVHAAIFSPDGLVLATTGSNSDPILRLWDATTGEARAGAEGVRGHDERHRLQPRWPHDRHRRI